MTRLLRLMLLPVLCLTQFGCLDTPAGNAVSADDAKPHWGRGGPRNGYIWVVYPDILAKWVREIPEIARGTPADQVIKRLGEPDCDCIAGPVTLANFIWLPYPDRGCDRWVQYIVAMDNRVEMDSSGKHFYFVPLSDASDIENITMIFDQDNHYKTYWVENPLHPSKMDAPFNPDPSTWDHDLTSLMLAGPAACTRPVVNQMTH